METIAVLGRVPDPGAGLPLAPAGDDLDRRRLALVPNPFDQSALEEALLLKDLLGGRVTAVACDDEGTDQDLYRALALGATGAVRLTGVAAGRGWVGSRERAEALAGWIGAQPHDLVLCGVQGPADADGQVPALLAGLLGHRYASTVVRLEVEDARILATQEYAGGRTGRLILAPPAVLGIQVSSVRPRYVSEMRIRLASMAGGVTEMPVPPQPGAAPVVRRLLPPAPARRAAMLPGPADATAAAILDLLRNRGLLA